MTSASPVSIRRKFFSLSDFPAVPSFPNRFSESNSFINVALEVATFCNYPIFLQIPRLLPLDFKDRPLLPFSFLEHAENLPVPGWCWNNPYDRAATRFLYSTLSHCFEPPFSEKVYIFLTGKLKSSLGERLIFEVTEPKDATHFFYIFEENPNKQPVVRGEEPLILLPMKDPFSINQGKLRYYCLVTDSSHALVVEPSFREDDLPEIGFFLAENRFDFQTIYEHELIRDTKAYFELKEDEERRQKARAESDQIKSKLIKERHEHNQKIFDAALATFPAILNTIIEENSDVISELKRDFGLDYLELFPKDDIYEVNAYLFFTGEAPNYKQLGSADLPPEEIIAQAKEAISDYLKTLRHEKMIEETLALLSNPSSPAS
ncbi:hypothetical protein IJG21_02195 [Candidatus Saccharibacteria bacterium]|nr:hypothetical protein [Candidatus Saccharibacteria bacterium]